MYAVYSVLTVAFFVVVSPYLLYQALRYRKYIANLPQRLGYLPLSFNLDGDESIWVHAVSVGEVLTARALLPELRERYPRLRLFLSTTTMTGQQVASNNLQYVDERLLLSVRPRLHRQAHAASGEAAAVHHAGDRDLAEPAARLPPRRRQDGARQRPHLVAIVSALPAGPALLPSRPAPRRSLLHAERRVRPPRSSTSAPARERVTVTGSLKFDSLELPGTGPADRGRNRVLRYFRISPDRPVVIAASTLKGEEEPVLEAFQRIRATMTQRAADHRAAQTRAVRRSRAASRAGPAGTSRAAASCASTPSRGTTSSFSIRLASSRSFTRLPPRCSSAAASSTLEATISSNRRCSGSQSYLVRTCRTSRRSPAPSWTTARRFRCGPGASSSRCCSSCCRDPVRRASLGAAARALVEANRGARGKSLAVIAQVFPSDASRTVVRPSGRSSST